MAEEWHLAFGRYLRTLRNRRGLSLQEVASLSQSFPDTVNKGYLSRCENGRQSLAFSKVIPLSRIYKVPADVLLERMELDQELERVGGPETEGMGFAELTGAGAKAMDEGRRWDAASRCRRPSGRTGQRRRPHSSSPPGLGTPCAASSRPTVRPRLGANRRR